MSVPVLEIRRLRKYWHDDFSIDVDYLDLMPGEVHVIVGENGSGKSALMRLLAGIDTRDSGAILLSGTEVEYGDVAESRSGGVQYQLQDPQLFENLSVAENIYFDNMPARRGLFHALNHFRLHADCVHLFRTLGIALDPEQPVARLGYAERQLVAAAKACVADAAVYIFDEPSAAMSEPERLILFRIIRLLKDRGVGVFYISHRLDEIKHVGDRVTVLHQGQVVETRAVEAVDRETLVRLMTGRIHTERYPRISVPIGPAVMDVRHLQSDHILRDVNFSLRKGEILGITGLMGSGRTRLANCLFGVVRPTAGSIAVDGLAVRFNDPHAALQSGLALVPEDRATNAMFHQHALLDNMTIAALRRFRNRVGLDGRVMRDLVRSYVDRLHILPGRMPDLLHNYSGGNQQKVMIARWLMKRAKIYIMDEPTRGVDVATKVDIYNAMNDMVAKGASIILISSEIEEILGLCDRVLVLSGGRMVCDLPRERATKEIILEFATNEE